MNSRRADVVVASTAVCLVAAAVAARILTDDRVAWWVAGLVAGGYAWVVLRYLILRSFGVWRLGRGKTPVRWAIAWVVAVCVDWVGTWVAAALGGVLAAGYPLDASGPLVAPFFRMLPASTVVVGGIAVAAVLVSLVLRPRPTTSS